MEKITNSFSPHNKSGLVLVYVMNVITFLKKTVSIKY